MDHRLAIRGEGGTELGRQLPGEIESLDQPGGPELAELDGATERLCIGGREACEERRALGFGDGGAGFGLLHGRVVGRCGSQGVTASIPGE
jgi:hypothetical protein